MTIIELFALMRKHLRVVIIVPVVCALLTAIFCFTVLPNTYTASVSMYVLTKSTSETNAITNQDLSASQMLTNDVATLIKSDRVQADAAKAMNLENLDDYNISVSSQTTTRVITMSVRGTSPSEVATVANQVAKTTDSVAQEVMEVQSINVIDKAAEPESPSGPPRALYTLVAFLFGLCAAIAFLVIMDTADTRVHTSDQASELLGVPVIGRIPVIQG